MFQLFSRKIVATVRPIGAEYAADCARLYAPAFAHPWSEAEFEYLLTSHTGIAHGSLDPTGRRLLGFVLSRKAADEAEILTLVVDPSSRRRGLGRALIGTHLGYLGSLGTKALFLEVEEENAAARGLYACYDFREVGRRTGYYNRADGNKATALTLKRAID